MAGESYYYTARKLSNLVYDFNKWDEFGDDSMPIATYQVFPFGGPGGNGSCGCPAWKRCKHLNALDEIINASRTDELPFLKWTPKGGWERVDI